MTPSSARNVCLRAVRGAWSDGRLAWGTMSRLERSTTLLMALLLFAGIVLRIQGIGWPPRNTFDEQFYGPTSHHMLLGVPDLHDRHPPVGKLFGAIGLLLFGYNSIGWRFTYLVFGYQNLVVAYWLAREVFESRRAGWFAATLLAADGFFLAYSRTALIDPILTCFVLWSLLAVVLARTWRGMLVAALLVGTATSVKWTGAFTLVPATLAILLYRNVRWTSLFWFGLSPVVHLLFWMAGLRLMGHPSSVVSAVHVIRDSLVFLHGTGKYANPLASPWYSWPALYHPIVVKLSTWGSTSRYASSAGNPVFWFSATACVVGLPIWRGVGALRSAWGHVGGAAVDPKFNRAVYVLASGWLALMALFAVSMGRHSFFYHYQPSYGFALVLLAGVLARVERRAPVAVFVFLALAAAALVHFAPVWAEFPLTEEQANRRLIFLPWRP